MDAFREKWGLGGEADFDLEIFFSKLEETWCENIKWFEDVCFLVNGCREKKPVVSLLDSFCKRTFFCTCAFPVGLIDGRRDCLFFICEIFETKRLFVCGHFSFENLRCFWVNRSCSGFLFGLKFWKLSLRFLLSLKKKESKLESCRKLPLSFPIYRSCFARFS